MCSISCIVPRTINYIMNRFSYFQVFIFHCCASSFVGFIKLYWPKTPLIWSKIAKKNIAKKYKMLSDLIWGLHPSASLTKVQIFLKANMQKISSSSNNQTFHLLESFCKNFNSKQFLVYELGHIWKKMEKVWLKSSFFKTVFLFSTLHILTSLHAISIFW